MTPWLTGLVAGVLATQAGAQAGSQSLSGTCNVAVQGSGNNTTIYCAGQDAAAPPAAKVRLVIGSFTQGGWIVGNFNPGFVDPYNSTLAISIDDDHVTSSSLDQSFPDQKLSLDAGEHFYTLDVDFTYLNGVRQSTSCSGILDAQTSAAIVPRVTITQDWNTGAIAPVNCGFLLR